MLLNIDWLQLHCKGVISDKKEYQIRRLNFTTRVFKCVDEVYLDKKRLATITHTPLSPILEPTMVLIKFDNWLLYDSNLWATVKSILEVYNLEFVGISRLDICCDFNKFANNLPPHNLIERFFTQKYKKIGQTKFRAIGEQKNELVFDYLRFGTNNSIVSSYLYNKTKELNEVKFKSWIYDTWIQGELDVSKNVWRLEFSLKGNQISMLRNTTGELINIDLAFLQENENLVSLFYSLQMDYFRFKVITGKSNISRERDVVLFPKKVTQFKRFIINENHESGRSDKIFIKKLENLNAELRHKNSDIQKHIDKIMVEFVTAKGLNDYYLSKIHGSVSKEIDLYKEKQMSSYQIEQQNKEINRQLLIDMISGV